MEDFEFFPDEEEEAAEEEGSNRVFIYAVAGLGGLLVVGICIIIAFAFYFGPRMREEIKAQNYAVQTANAEMAGVIVSGEPTATETPSPTDILQPTPTERPTATRVLPTLTPAEAAGPAPAGATATLRPTATSRPAATPGSTTGASTPDTGIGVVGASALALGLVFLLVVVRRLRQTAR
jgi:cytoskeletal protein RodZ